MSTAYYYLNKDKILERQRQRMHRGQTEIKCSGCGRMMWTADTTDTLCRFCKHRLEKYGTTNITNEELNIIWARTQYIRRCGSKVFNCAKCGALSSSKDLNQTLCKKCRPKKTETEKVAQRKAYYEAHKYHIREYSLKYSRLGKTKNICAKCGYEFWHLDPNETLCGRCRLSYHASRQQEKKILTDEERKAHQIKHKEQTESKKHRCGRQRIFTDEERKQRAREACRRYYQSHKEQVKEAVKKYKERRAAYMRRYYQEHKEQLKEYKRRWAQKHKEQLKEYGQRWVQEHKERVREIYRLWYHRHKDKTSKSACN